MMYVTVSCTILPSKFVCEIGDENHDISTNSSTSKFPEATLEYSPTCNSSYPTLWVEISMLRKLSHLYLKKPRRSTSTYKIWCGGTAREIHDSRLANNE